MFGHVYCRNLTQFVSKVKNKAQNFKLDIQTSLQTTDLHSFAIYIVCLLFAFPQLGQGLSASSQFHSYFWHISKFSRTSGKCYIQKFLAKRWWKHSYWDLINWVVIVVTIIPGHTHSNPKQVSQVISRRLAVVKHVTFSSSLPNTTIQYSYPILKQKWPPRLAWRQFIHTQAAPEFSEWFIENFCQYSSLEKLKLKLVFSEYY